jgi:acetyl esterase/lipase
MKPVIILLLLFFLLPDFMHAQLVTWRDIIDSDMPEPTVRIQYGNDSLQFGDLWLPENSEPHTTVILIHGGCWLSFYPGVDLMHLMANELRNQGFAVWNIEYRRIGHDGGGYPGTFLDIANGADFLREVAVGYGLNLDRVIASGHSAGGHLATWIAARKNIPEHSPLFYPDPIAVHGVISLAGINDLERYLSYGASSCGSETVAQLTEINLRGDDAFLDTSPAKLLPLGVPFTEVSAAFDAPVPPFFGYHFVNLARDSGDNAALILQPNAGHFEMISPWTNEWKEVMDLFRSLSDKLAYGN